MQQLRLIPILLLFSISFTFSLPHVDFINSDKFNLEETNTQVQLCPVHNPKSKSKNEAFFPLNPIPSQLQPINKLRYVLRQTTNFPMLLFSPDFLNIGVKYSYLASSISRFNSSARTPLTQLDTSDTLTQIPEVKVTFRSFLYLFIALIGFFVAIILNFNPRINTVAKALISSFVFIHSFFIFHIFFSITNYQFEFPNSYRMSTPFSFLYGPLLYFYFKRITQHYEFKKWDLLHLLPTVALLVYLVPIYFLTKDEKLAMMLTKASGGFTEAKEFHVVTLVAAKILSLLVYGYFIARIYLKSKARSFRSYQNLRWQKYILSIHLLYILTYSIYAFLIINNFYSNAFFHFQIIAMSFMVLYIGYSAYIQPDVFSSMDFQPDEQISKYEKSGLTESLSQELKNQMLLLLEAEKIYKENDLNLEYLAQKLNTSRHNASQVINEHFKLSFHELINTYRINEAKLLLKNDHQKNLHIIDIAYEVGYNNKVTFNKAFKKHTKLTPSEYQKKHEAT